MVKLEMLVVSEQLQNLDQTTIWWLRDGKTGGKKSQAVCVQAEEVILGWGVSAICWLSGAT